MAGPTPDLFQAGADSAPLPPAADDRQHLNQELESVRGELRRTRDELVQLKGHFLAMLNHEIRTPLSGIIGMTDLLLETPLEPDQQEYVQATRSCADGLFQMLNATLEYSALASGNVRLDESEFRLAETIRGALLDHVLRADMNGIYLHCDMPEDLPDVVIGDGVKLRQLLGHLLSNAVKFTAKGEVEVTVALDRSGVDGKLRVAVHDTGIGIPPDKMAVIWDSFRQAETGLARSYSGLGLGLALSQQLVGLLGGTLTVESTENVGSTFSFTIPLHLPTELERPQTVIDAEAIPVHTPRVLVVEDNDVSRRVAAHMLQRGGLEHHVVDGATAAIEAASREHFDLVLMDLQMPNIDGLQTTMLLRKLPGYAEVPIIALTANSGPDYRELCRKAGMQDFIAKPVQFEELTTVLKRHLK